MFLNAGLSLKDGQGNGSLSYWGPLWFPGDDKATGEASILHHLVTEELEVREGGEGGEGGRRAGR